MIDVAAEWTALTKKYGKDKFLVDDEAVTALNRLGFRHRNTVLYDKYSSVSKRSLPVRQVRASYFYTVQLWLDLEQISFYLEKGSKKLPYFVKDRGGRLWLWDGHHRLIARRIAKYPIYGFIGEFT